MLDPRSLWAPVLSDEFGWAPWHIERLTVDEFNAAADYLKEKHR